MATVLDTEEARRATQWRLDQLKSQKERNKWGQFATPPALSLDICNYLWNRFGRRRVGVRFLDPAIGTGSFFSAFAQRFPSNRIVCATGVELDPLFGDAARSLWADHGLEVIEADFTQLPPPPYDGRYNLVLTNPPYVRHHHLRTTEKKRLAALVSERLGVRISGLAGLYCYFMLLSDSWLADRAMSAWLIPSEFMDVNYGGVVKRYLLDCVSLLHIHRFCPSDVQFADALVSSAIVIFEKRKPGIGHQVKFSFGGPLSHPNVVQSVDARRLCDVRKWTSLPARFHHVQKPGVITLGELFDVKRGLATGNNAFFIIPRARQTAEDTKPLFEADCPQSAPS